MTHLDLSDNCIGLYNSREGVFALRTLLECNHHLQRLDLEGNPFTTWAYRIIHAALEKNKTLTQLNMKNAKVLSCKQDAQDLKELWDRVQRPGIQIAWSLQS